MMSQNVKRAAVWSTENKIDRPFRHIHRFQLLSIGAVDKHLASGKI
jgi:hypothetical protein